MAWTDEKVELAKSLWLEGHSAPTIAQHLGRGFSRNAVIGKMHRLGLVRKKVQGQKRPIPEKRIYPKPVLEFAKPINRYPERVHDTSHVKLPPSKKMSLVERQDHHCHFLTGPGEYCGHPVVPGKRYCEGHCQIVYMPMKRAI